MRIATLGYDAGLVERILAVEQRGHQIAHCYDLQAEASDVAARFPRLATDQRPWEELLDRAWVDVVLVAVRPGDPRTAERRRDQLCKLVQSGIPLVLVHPACDMLTALQLDMIRRDVGGPIVVHAPAWTHPLTQQLLRSCSGNPTKRIVAERFSAQRSSREAMDRFARDGMIIQSLMAPVDQVNAAGTGLGDDRIELTVTLVDRKRQMARWSLEPSGAFEGLKLRVEQEGRSTTLQLPDQGPAQLSTHPPAGDLPSPELDEPLLDETWHLRWHANAQLLDDLRRAADDPTRFDSASKHLPADGQPEDDWQAACRVLELEEAIERSARRGRAIDLHHERVTERETFKSIMAAGGCLLLLWVLMLLVAASVIEGLRIGSPLFGKIWILLLAGPLVLFLGLQLLQFAFGSRDER